jgi:LysM domain
MKNPLVLFTGAALATLAALAGLNMTDWRGGLSDSQKPAEAASQASDIATPSGEQTPAAGAIGESPKSAIEVGGTAEMPADEAGKTLEKLTEMAAIPAVEPPKAETGANKPELDTVRVESDGQAIVAGRAEPGAEISLKLADQVIGKGLVNADGSWVVVPDQLLPKGPNEITIEQKMGDSAPVTAAQSIAVAVPEEPGRQAMVALTEPGTATRVLQPGGTQEQAALTESAPQPEPQQPTAPQATETSAAPAQPRAPETAATPAESAPAETNVAKVEVPDAVAPPEETTPAAEPAGENVPLGLDAVDYNDKGDIIFSGRAKPGTAARLYVDNRAVGDAIVDSGGNWTFAGKDIIAPGNHDLRVDQIDKTGKVIARVELPFMRENAEAVAALNEPPAAAQTETQAEASAAQPPAEPPAQPTAETNVQPPAEPPAQPTGSPAQPTAQRSAELPAPQTPEQPQATTNAPAQTAAEPQAAPEPEKTAEQQSQVSASETPKVAEAEPQQTAEVETTEPAAPAPAPEQPAAGGKKEEATTTTAAVEAAKAVNPDTPRLGKVVIQPGNNLWKLSRVIYGRGKNYTVIYQANKDQIRNPRRIYPGQILAIPGALPPEKIDPKRKEPLTSAEGGAAPQ